MSHSHHSQKIKASRLKVCPSGKASYQDRVSAMLFISRQWHDDDWWKKGKRSDKRLARAYQCPICGHWHLTSHAS